MTTSGVLITCSSDHARETLRMYPVRILAGPEVPSKPVTVEFSKGSDTNEYKIIKI